MFEKVAPEVGIAFAREQEREHLEFLRRREQVRVEMGKDRERRQTISELIRQQQQLHDRRMQLQQASTTVECMKALKRWDAEDLGQGHLQGGSRLHFKNRAEVLERLRRRADRLPADLSNDWAFFLKHWDRWKVNSMRDHRKGAWGSQFLATMKELAGKWHPRLRRAILSHSGCVRRCGFFLLFDTRR